VLVKKGSFANESFLVKALEGQYALLVIVPIPNMDLGNLFIHAAARAGVPYILPTKFGVDAPKVENEHSMMAPKMARRRLIEELGVSSWIAVIVNFWLDANIQSGLWGVQVGDRKAEIFKGADAKISTTTVVRCGEGIPCYSAYRRPNWPSIRIHLTIFHLSSFLNETSSKPSNAPLGQWI
jgi:hypothetical protein